jgi:hypothetical protein
VPTYIVERVMPGATMESLTVMCQVLGQACHTLTARGNEVHHLRSTFTPGDSRCRCLFEAPNDDLVQAVNEVAQIPYIRILLAVELIPKA